MSVTDAEIGIRVAAKPQQLHRVADRGNGIAQIMHQRARKTIAIVSVNLSRIRVFHG